MTEIWTILRTLNWMTADFKKNHIPSPRLEAEMILAHVLGMERINLYVQFERPLSNNELSRLKNIVRKKRKGTPVNYLTGKKEFFSKNFIVTPDVLIPRPETEEVIEYIINKLNLPDIALVLDFGTGSGNIALILAGLRPNWVIAGTDISENAVEIAKENQKSLDIENKVEFIVRNGLSGWELPDRFDLIVSNPPYISDAEYELLDSSIRDYEPAVALRGGEDGMDFYRHIYSEKDNLLVPGGCIVCEIGENQPEKLKKLFGGETEIVNDLNNKPRILVHRSSFGH